MTVIIITLIICATYIVALYMRHPRPRKTRKWRIVIGRQKAEIERLRAENNRLVDDTVTEYLELYNRLQKFIDETCERLERIDK